MLRADARNYHRITEEGLPVMRSRSTTRRSARAGMAVVVLAGGLLLGVSAPAFAQVTTVETVPPEVDEDGRTAGDRIDRIVVTLRVLAAVLLVGTGAYWGQSRPANRVAAGLADPGSTDRLARVVAEAGPSEEGVLEARMPTIQPPDEVEAVTLLSGSEPSHEPPDGPASGQSV